VDRNAEQSANAAQVGWRFAVGAALIVGGYGAWMLIPMAAASHLAPAVKTMITGVLAATPGLSKLGAIAVMGKAGFNALKARLFGLLRHARPKEHVSRARYSVGLVLFWVPLIIRWHQPYSSGRIIDWSTHGHLYSEINDLVMVVGLFVLGGEFWEKLRALFLYDATVVRQVRQAHQ